MQTRRQRTISARIILCWVLAIQIVLSQQAGWEVNFLTKPPGATVEIGKPFEVMFEIVDQQGKRVGPGVLVTVSLTGATFNGDSTIMTQTDNDGRVRLVGLIPVGAGPITLRIVATVPGAPAPMVQRSFTWEAVNPSARRYEPNEHTGRSESAMGLVEDGTDCRWGSRCRRIDTGRDARRRASSPTFPDRISGYADDSGASLTSG